MFIKVELRKLGKIVYRGFDEALAHRICMDHLSDLPKKHYQAPTPQLKAAWGGFDPADHYWPTQ